MAIQDKTQFRNIGLIEQFTFLLHEATGCEIFNVCLKKLMHLGPKRNFNVNFKFSVEKQLTLCN